MRLIFCLFLLVSVAARAEERPPNIVLILADDLGIEDLHCYGGQTPTPNLDRLAAEGMRFTQAKCALPLCSPSRAALLSGKNPARLHLTTFLPGRADAPSQKLLQPEIAQGLPLTEQLLPELLKTRGYTSACLGKWHLGNQGFMPQQQGFDTVLLSQANTTPSDTEGGKGEYLLTAKAGEFMAANRERPFFLYLAHNAPHIPLAAKAALVEKYKESFNPVYAAMLETLDTTVGLLLAKLEELKLREQTIVIFTSDNGGLHVAEGREDAATHHAARGGKGFLYEGGLRDPLIVNWPGHVPVRECNETVVLGDLMPTLLEMAGTAVPTGLDYVSLAPLWRGEAQPGLAEREFYWHFPHYSNQGGRPGGVIQMGPWKLIENYEDGSLELYNLEKDPRETLNLALLEAARVATMRGKLEAWRRSAQVQENLPNPAYDERLGKPLYQDLDSSRLPQAERAADLRGLLQPWRLLMNQAVQGGRDAQRVGGFFRLLAKEAQVHGTALHYEPLPQKDTLGFWKNVEDSASWPVTIPEAARYRVEVLQGCGKGSGGATVEVQVAGQILPFTVQETGHFQNFVCRTIGEVALPAGAHTLSVVPKTKPGGAVMDLRQVTLTRLAE